MITLILRWVLNAMALMVLPALIDGISVTGFLPALIAAIVISLLNSLLRPMLILLTLPATVFSLGIFALVINALLFWAASGLVNGVHISGFWSAFWGALLYSVLSSLVDLAVGSGRQNIIRIRRF